MTIKEIKIELINELSKDIPINDEVLIYGAGNTSLLYEKCFINENINILYFVDNNPSKIGNDFLGKEVISVESMINNYSEKTILISSANMYTFKEIKCKLDSLGINNYSIDEYVFHKNMDNIIKIFDLLNDDISKITYANVILARMGRKELDLSLVNKDQYFAINEFAVFASNEVFVDCGAYVGDTIEKYLFVKSGIFDKIYAFEPEPRNFTAMQYRTDRLNREWALSEEKITLINAGIGRTSKISFVSGTNNDMAALGSKINENGLGSQIEIYSLDDYFKNQKITFLKADIESYEESMLLGAKQIIARDRPKIAVCIYHNAADMYRIPALIHKLDSSYKLDIRQHYGNLTETVLYAY